MGRKYRIALLLVLLSHAIDTAFCQTRNLTIRSFSIHEGLSNPNVQCIARDSYGFMWLGTSNGLNRFDGYEIVCYYRTEAIYKGLPSSDIRSLYNDSKGNLWVGTTKGLCLYDPVKDKFNTYLQEDSASLGSFDIVNIMEDEDLMLWLAAYRSGVILLNPAEKTFRRFSHDPGKPQSLSSNNVFSVFQDSDKNIWVTTYDGGVNLYIPEDLSFLHFINDPKNPNSILGNNIHAMAEDSSRILWFACNYAGLSSINMDDINNGRFTNYTNRAGINSINDNDVRILCSDNKGGIWIGTANGQFDHLSEGIFYHYELTNCEKGFPGEDAVNAMYSDPEGNLWMGNSYSGFHFIHPESPAFTVYRSDYRNKSSLSHNKVWEFAEDSEGYVWIATDGGGLNRFDPKTEKFISYTISNSNLPTNDILSVFVDAEDNIWLGTWHCGLIKLERKTNRFQSFTIENTALLSNNIFDIDEDSKGNLWLATQDGLSKMDGKNLEFTTFTPENSELIFHQMEVVRVDQSDNVLIGNVQGFIIFNPVTGKFTNFQNVAGDLNSLSDNFVTSVTELDSGIVWISTNAGLNRLDLRTNRITRYLMKDGLPSDIILGVEEDESGYLWISTNRGLVRFDIKKNIYENYGVDDGLQDYIFIKKSHLKAKDGILYFGGINGFNRINTKMLIPGKSTIPIVFTDLLISNKPVRPDDETRILRKQLYLTDSITLSHKYPGFTVKFAALAYINTDNIQYTYKLEGYDPDWNFIGKQRMATYTNLDPGKYILKVRSHSIKELPDENIVHLNIKVLQPWWKTLIFKLLLILVILALIFSIVLFRLREFKEQKRELEKQVSLRTDQLIDKNEELTAQQEALTHANKQLEENQKQILTQKNELEIHRNNLEKLVSERTADLEKAKRKAEESDLLKSAFLANLSHEIRTPMNAIVGFASLLDVPDLSEAEKKKFFEMVSNNCDLLTILINDIIDISLIETNQLKISRLPFIADAICEELLTYFKSVNEKSIEFVFENRNLGTQLHLENDPARFKQILTNLLSNAYKYTEQGTIKFGYQTEGDKVRFYVTDTGIGVRESDQDTIFNHFHKIDTHNDKLYRGVGIGLSICQSLVKLMGGNIWVESKIGKGSSFNFTLPLEKTTNIPSIENKKELEDVLDLSGYTVLIAEDDVTNYILLKKILKPTHAEILWAKSGDEAVEMVQKAKNIGRLLVLMDIKMPIMNGIEALRIIRQKYASLPVIAVTAYAQESDRAEILKNNFNGYVTKPIMRPYLMRIIRRELNM
jgi:signal transduction histidine kinase/CheY-like chemotaxis protein/streptogramin lyase